MTMAGSSASPPVVRTRNVEANDSSSATAKLSVERPSIRSSNLDRNLVSRKNSPWADPGRMSPFDADRQNEVSPTSVTVGPEVDAIEPWYVHGSVKPYLYR